MVYFAGEEMTRYTMQLILDKWIQLRARTSRLASAAAAAADGGSLGRRPSVDTAAWEYFDLSCKHRDATDDEVLAQGCAAGARVKAIFKEPTITPSEAQRLQFGLKNVRAPPGPRCARATSARADLAPTCVCVCVCVCACGVVLAARSRWGARTG
eukprot:scaffold134_cov268-Prasinococcus_capsulatus_cf.AAC.3